MDPLGTLIDWIAMYGVIGLFAIGVAERFMPLLPSYGVLVAIGIAAANGSWSVTVAVAGTAMGSLAGCLLLYGLAIALGEDRAYGLLKGIGRLAGMSASRLDKVSLSFHTHQRLLTFGSQLVPTVRLISPAIAGLFRFDARIFVMSTMAGILVWNSLFICVGHIAAAVAPSVSASVLAIKVLIVLIVIEATLGLAWRWVYRRTREGA